MRGTPGLCKFMASFCGLPHPLPLAELAGRSYLQYLPTAKASDGTPVEPDVFPIEDNAYVGDIQADFKGQKKENAELAHVRFLFKKKMFRETDDAISEPMFITLSYLQAQHDYLQGNYPVARDDASQIASLQIQARSALAITKSSQHVHSLDSTHGNRRWRLGAPWRATRKPYPRRWSGAGPIPKHQAPQKWQLALGAAKTVGGALGNLRS